MTAPMPYIPGYNAPTSNPAYPTPGLRGPKGDAGATGAAGPTGPVGPQGQPGAGGAGTVIASRAALRAFQGAPQGDPSGNPSSVVEAAYHAGGSIGGGTWAWVADTTTPDDGGTFAAVTTGAGRVGAWRRVYSGALHAAWFGAVGDGTTDDQAAIAAAVAALPADGGEVVLPRARCALRTQLKIVNRRSVRFRGEGPRGSELFWLGTTAGIPMVQFVNARECTVEQIGFIGLSVGNGGHPPSVLLDFHADDAQKVSGTLNPTQCRVEKCFFGGDGVDQADRGIAFTTAPGQDHNNDLSTIEDCVFTGLTTAGVSFEHSQSKGHQVVNCAFPGPMQYGVTNHLGGGSFSVSGGSTGNVSQAFARVDRLTDCLNIEAMNMEGCARLCLVGTFTSASFAVRIAGNRFANNALNADGIAILVQAPGPVVVLGNIFDGDNTHGPCSVEVSPNACPGALLVMGNSWNVGAAPQLLAPSTAGSTAFVRGNNYRDGSDVEQAVPDLIQGNGTTLLDVFLEPDTVRTTDFTPVITTPSNDIQAVGLTATLRAADPTGVTYKLWNKTWSAAPGLILAPDGGKLIDGAATKTANWLGRLDVKHMSDGNWWTSAGSPTATVPPSASLVARYVADDLAGSAGGVAVASWAGHGAGSTLLQATAGKQPLCKTGGPNGHKVVVFDGVDDWLQVVVPLLQPCTVVLVYKQLAFGSAFPSPNSAVFAGSFDHGLYAWDPGSGPTSGMYCGSIILDGALANGAYEGVVCGFGTTASYLRSSRVTRVQGTVGSGSFGAITLGAKGDGSSNTNIAVAEVLVYTGVLALTSGALNQLEQYLSNTYGVT